MLYILLPLDWETKRLVSLSKPTVYLKFPTKRAWLVVLFALSASVALLNKTAMTLVLSDVSMLQLSRVQPNGSLSSDMLLSFKSNWMWWKMSLLLSREIILWMLVYTDITVSTSHLENLQTMGWGMGARYPVHTKWTHLSGHWDSQVA